MKYSHCQRLADQLSRRFKSFHYSRGQYALMLLANALEQPITLRDLKPTVFGRLIEKPCVQEVLRAAGSLDITSRDLQYTQRQLPDRQAYRISFSQWGDPDSDVWMPDYDQTSRPGMNLVLQLNFPRTHQRDFANLLSPASFAAFNYSGHPVSKSPGESRLAWSRIDIDLVRREALIEEVQCDWVRDATRYRTEIASARNSLGRNGTIPRNLAPGQYPPGTIHAMAEYLKTPCDQLQQRMNTYIDRVLAPYAKVWDEAVLAATIHLLRRNLGIGRIYYHTFESGNHMKHLDEGDQPPRSLYTDLPRQFAFVKTMRPPRMLMEDRQARERIAEADKPLYWHVLSL